MRTAKIRRPRIRVQRFSDLSVNRMVPNVLTLLALCAGMTAIRLAVNGQFRHAVFAIIAAGIFDGLDGRIARLLKATSRFGAELDSLADFISFGVAPAAVMYLWTMAALGSLGWAIVLFYAVCCALRLARFNTQLDAELPPYATNFFVGAPAPAGAGLVMVPMFLNFASGVWLFQSPYFNAFSVSGIALLMISRIPTVSLKGIRIRHHQVIPTLLGVVVVTALVTTAPWPTLSFIGVVYLASIPATIRAARRSRRAAGTRGSDGPSAVPLPGPIPLSPERMPREESRG
jgi:CDP-diacylglycerol---serine O-phosphatidyltransferase